MDVDAHRAQRLFQAVVTQALLDACLESDPARKNYNDIVRHRSAARSWLLNNGDDFAKVVTLAGYDPNDIRERAIKLSTQNWRSDARLAA